MYGDMARNEGTSSSSGTLQQWASSVLNFSSEYDSCSWPARAATGAPKVYPRYGDIPGAWASGICDDKQFIELEYETPVYVSAINIYETYNCGGVRRVSLRSKTGSWDSIWETEKVEHIKESRIFSPGIKIPKYKTNAVRLDLSCSRSRSWVEIDAVLLVGRKYKTDPPPPISALTNALARLVNDKQTGDVVFNVQGTTVHGHRAILSVRSAAFKNMLKDVTESAVIIDDINPPAFIGVLYYLYSGGIPRDYTPCVLVDVWRAASMLGIHGLMAYSMAKIDDKLETANVVDVFVNATKGSQVPDDIREVCLDFMASNMAKVTLTPHFKKLPQELMLEIIQLATERMSLH